MGIILTQKFSYREICEFYMLILLKIKLVQLINIVNYIENGMILF